MFYRSFVLLSLLLLVGCSQLPTVSERTDNALALAEGWQPQEVLNADGLPLVILLPKTKIPSDTVKVFIEGDGLAWISRSQPSSNPTPLNPVALKLALNSKSGAVAYLGRPCQYITDNQQCTRQYWTGSRFSTEVIELSSQAIDQIKLEYRATDVELVGYSGGAAVALLLAAKRDDVVSVVTVAGNLDTDRWTEFHRITPLAGSLNPANYIQELSRIPQVHYVGENDKIIPPELVSEFVLLFRKSDPIEMIVVDEFDHHCCWDGFDL